MRLRLSGLVLAIVLVPTLANADDHRADWYGGFSGGGGGSKLFGFHESLGIGFPQTKAENLSIVGDLSVHFGSSDAGTDVTQVAFMGGARYTFAKDNSRHKPSAHFLAGTVYSNDGGSGGKNGAIAVGGTYEFLLKRGAAPMSGWGIRFQIDYFNRADRSNFTRISSGIVYRFVK
jgi:hypothetical protein